MLARIINEFKRAKEPLDLSELSRHLDIERSALEGMLELLVRQGKLREVGTSTETCIRCTSRLSCAQIQRGNMMGKAYKLADD